MGECQGRLTGQFWLPLELFRESQAHCRAVCRPCGFFRMMCVEPAGLCGRCTGIPGPRLTEQLLPKQPESSQQKEEMWSVRSWFVHICSLLPTSLWPK